ncbi:cupin domain-containing protein [Geomonas subterranea]|uniref:Cupin domain-containing protein n=1 Tax=Geomonas subterranea TaxID=2847989 RepID=A0ABX8LNU5_9BACT|nr:MULTISPECIES: cupin domain-containing protein [Geomonas]QXE92611.1 cupin domain-containing protein [Geomonas subterranea]QXM09290.1 cupin domain-containing protein [Geomonas subterranea]
MKRTMLFLMMVFFSLTAAGVAAEKKVSKAAVQQVMVLPDQIQWHAGPPAIPGAQMAVLDGDMAKAGFFVARIKLPAGARIAPHYHGNVERVTVISGTVKLAMGVTQDNPTVLPAGSYFALPPKTVHNAWVDEETVLQIATRGPWSMHAVKGAK